MICDLGRAHRGDDGAVQLGENVLRNPRRSDDAVLPAFGESLQPGFVERRQLGRRRRALAARDRETARPRDRESCRRASAAMQSPGWPCRPAFARRESRSSPASWDYRGLRSNGAARASRSRSACSRTRWERPISSRGSSPSRQWTRVSARRSDAMTKDCEGAPVLDEGPRSSRRERKRVRDRRSSGARRSYFLAASCAAVCAAACCSPGCAAGRGAAGSDAGGIAWGLRDGAPRG